MTPREIAIAKASGGASITVLVVPSASRSEITGPHADALRIRVSAAPERGRANREAAKLLTHFFGVPATLIKGATSRRKRFLLEGLDVVEVRRRIQKQW